MPSSDNISSRAAVLMTLALLLVTALIAYPLPTVAGVCLVLAGTFVFLGGALMVVALLVYISFTWSKFLVSKSIAVAQLLTPTGAGARMQELTSAMVQRTQTMVQSIERSRRKHATYR